jgi:hypothetical protein
MNSSLYLSSNNLQFGSVSQGTVKIPSDVSRVLSFALKSAQMVYKIQNINVNNNRIGVTDNASSADLVIPAGIYTYETLRAEIENRLNLLPLLTTYVVSFVDGKYSIVASNPTTFIRTTVGRTFLDMIDIKFNVETLNHEGGLNVDINYTNLIYIKSNRLHEYKTIGDSASVGINNILGIVHVNKDILENPNSADAPVSVNNKIICERYDPLKKIPWRIDDIITSCDIALYDDRGKLLPDGLVSYTLEIICDI